MGQKGLASPNPAARRGVGTPVPGPTSHPGPRGALGTWEGTAKGHPHRGLEAKGHRGVSHWGWGALSNSPQVLGPGMFPPNLPPWGPSSVFGLAMGCCDVPMGCCDVLVGARSTPRTGGASGSEGLPVRPLLLPNFWCSSRRALSRRAFAGSSRPGSALGPVSLWVRLFFWGVFGVGFCLCSSFPPAGPGR